MRYLLLSMFLVATTIMAVPGDVEYKLPTPGPCPTGLAFDGTYLWVADRKTDTLYAIDPVTGEINKVIPSPGYWPMGLAFDGKYLWNVDLDDRLVYKIEPNSGTIEDVIYCPCVYPQGLTYDGTYLWVSDSKTDMIYKLDTRDGTVLTSFVAPASASTGLTFDGKYLWVSDHGRDEIYMVTKDGEVLLIIASPFHYPYGMAFDGEHLWSVDYAADTIYRIRVADDEYYSVSDEKYAIVEYTQELRNYGPGMVRQLDFYLAIPENRVNQKLLGELEFNPYPTDFVTDRWGQRFAHYRFTNVKVAQSIKVSMKVRVKTCDVRYYILPDRVGSLSDIPREIKRKWLVDGSKYQIHNPIIQKAVKEAVGDERNPYWMMRKIFKYVIDHVDYELAGGWEPAPVVLQRGKGSCSEYSFVFIALCRAAGLPARYVGAVTRREEDSSWDRVFHRWTEVYIPPYGWIPVDPSGGDTPSPRGQANAIGHIRNCYLITTVGGGDSEYLGWSYNSTAKLKSYGKCEVELEKVAEWEPLKPTILGH